MSPLGVELVVPEDEPFSKLDPVDLEISIAGQRMTFEGLIVDVIRETDEIKLMGIRTARRVERGANANNRSSPRWLCSDAYFPTAFAASPYMHNDTLRFQGRDISENGMQLICSLRNKFLLEGMKLQLAVSFPMIGAFTCTVRIVWTGLATSAGKDVLKLGVEFVKITQDMRQTMAQYLLQFSNVDSLSELRKFGLNPQSLFSAVDFLFVKTEEDYRAVLNLRRLAHEAAGNIEPGKYKDEDMGDINDARSRIVIGKYKGKVIATARLHFNTINEQMEHERYVEWPSHLPRRDQIIEVSRAATHPDFRQSDLLVGLLQYLAATTRHEKPYFVLASWESMIGFYKKIGFAETGLSHSEPLWNKDQHIMIARANPVLLCKGISPIYWNLMWRPVAEHMLRNGLLEPTGIEKIRLSIYRSFAPLAKAIAMMRRRPRPSKRD